MVDREDLCLLPHVSRDHNGDRVAFRKVHEICPNTCTRFYLRTFRKYVPNKNAKVYWRVHQKISAYTSEFERGDGRCHWIHSLWKFHLASAAASIALSCPLFARSPAAMLAEYARRQAANQ